MTFRNKVESLEIGSLILLKNPLFWYKTGIKDEVTNRICFFLGVSDYSMVDARGATKEGLRGNLTAKLMFEKQIYNVLICAEDVDFVSND